MLTNRLGNGSIQLDRHILTGFAKNSSVGFNSKKLRMNTNYCSTTHEIRFRDR